MLGFGLDDSAVYWTVLCRHYFGLDDLEEVERQTDALVPYARLVECIANSRLIVDDEEGPRQVMLPLVRKSLLALIRTAQLLTW